jgi:hypothetical protein
MLSYLKDANQLPAAAEMNSQSQNPTESLSGPADYLTVAGHGKKLRQSTILLCALFAVGAGVVFFMIKKTTPVAANAAPSQDQLQLEAALVQIEKMKNDMNSQMNNVVGRFYQFSNVSQIGVDELKKNPFRRELNAGPVQTPDNEAMAAQQRQMLMAEARSQSGQMELWSITSTPRGMCCMIGDKVYYVGDMVGAMKIQSIETKRVVLDYKGIPVELTIE